MWLGDCGEERAARGESRGPLGYVPRWRRWRGSRRSRIHLESAGKMEARGRGIYFGEKLTAVSSQFSVLSEINPPVAYLGRARVCNRWVFSPYSPCLFSGAMALKTLRHRKSFAGASAFP